MDKVVVAVEKWTPERRMERTRSSLLASARHVFARRGFEGASLDEIADAAGYTRGAIYRYFANKEELFLAVADAFDPRVLDILGEQIELDTDAAVNNRQRAATWMKAVTADREAWALGLELSLFQYRNPAARKRSADAHVQHRTTVAAFMEHYTAETGMTLKVPAEVAAAILLIVSDGFAQAARIDDDTEDLFATFLDLFLPTVMKDPQTRDIPG